MIKELILYSDERWQYWVSLIGKQYSKLYPAPAGSKHEGFLERRILINVAESEYPGYIELVSQPV